MLVVQCDRCKKNFISEEDNFLLERDRLILGSFDEHGFYEDEFFDLCPDCMREVREWLGVLQDE